MTFPERPPLGVPTGLGAYLAPGVTSFTDFVAATAPHLLPGRVPPGTAPVSGASTPGGLDVPHGTTIVALTFSEGVVIAGDRRATQGNVIAQRDIEKVFITDTYSAVGFAGTAGNGLQMVRLYSVDLEHYEKTEGVTLSLDGKANKLAGMVQQNLAAAKLLIVDELGYVPLSQTGAELLFEIFSQRHERSSTIVTEEPSVTVDV